jgi:hypothetical protein
MNQEKKKLVLLLIVLLLAGISPNLFPAAQAGIAKLSSTAVILLIPSVVLIFVLIIVFHRLKYSDLRRQTLNGILAGLAGTLGLEIVREIGFRMGGMPGDMPKLLGVLLLNRFAYGPSFWSNIAGWSYHFWNGAAFGIIYSLIFGRGRIWTGILYALLIATGFMVSPATTALGIGVFGLHFKHGYEFLTTVILAHLAFGSIVGFVINKTNKDAYNIIERLKLAFSNSRS